MAKPKFSSYYAKGRRGRVTMETARKLNLTVVGYSKDFKQKSKPFKPPPLDRVQFRSKETGRLLKTKDVPGRVARVEIVRDGEAEVGKYKIRDKKEVEQVRKFYKAAPKKAIPLVEQNRKLRDAYKTKNRSKKLHMKTAENIYELKTMEAGKKRQETLKGRSGAFEDAFNLLLDEMDVSDMEDLSYDDIENLVEEVMDELEGEYGDLPF